MNGVATGSQRQVNKRVDIQITGHWFIADAVSFIRFFDMQRETVRFRINGD
jgi:hypothetical protein